MTGVLAVTLAVLAVAVAVPGIGTALHLGMLAAAAVVYREPAPRGPVPRARFLVMIPAHNEEEVIADTLAAVNADRRDGDHVVVIADRCTDKTVVIAREHDATVLERGDGAEPGRAPTRQDGVLYTLGRPTPDAVADGGPPEWDALVMIDADSIIAPGFFDACERMLATGATVLQARNEAEPPGRAGGGLAARTSLAAYTLQGIVQPRGRDRLGMLVRLRGTGMVMRREVVEHFPFRAPASEDLVYSLDLCLAGVVPRHVDSARMRSASPRSVGVLSGQMLRFEAGRMAAGLAYVPKLLRRRTRAALEAAWFLLTPPFAVAAGSLGAGVLLAVAAAALGAGAGVAVVLGGFLVLLCATLLVGLVQGRAGLDTWLALAAAPFYVPWKLMVQLRAVASVRRGDTHYGPTARS